MNFHIDAAPLCLIEKLEQAGYSAYLVGGCVRDLLLNHVPNDWDIATSAMPEQVRDVFEKVIPTGLKHGTVTVIIDKYNIEVTTYRRDGEYEDSRHPEQVNFVDDISLDLSRRDFTINAMAYNPRKGLVDLFGGVIDIEKGVIRCVGDADTRFNEDALRMLRSIRFSTKLGFIIEEYTLNAIIKNAYLITNISSERIRDELEKTIVGIYIFNLSQIHTSGLDKYIFPELATYFEIQDNMDKTLNMINLLPRDTDLRLSALFLSLGDKVKLLLRTLKFDNKSISNISNIVKYANSQIPLSLTGIKSIIKDTSIDIFEKILLIKEQCNPAEYKRLLPLFNEIKINHPITLKDLNINGEDLIHLGITDGKAIGNILLEILKIIWENPTLNDKEHLINMAKKLI